MGKAVPLTPGGSLRRCEAPDDARKLPALDLELASHGAQKPARRRSGFFHLRRIGCGDDIYESGQESFTDKKAVVGRYLALMPSDKITVGLKLSSFLGKGPRYLCAYARWRAWRAASFFLGRRAPVAAPEPREADAAALWGWRRRGESKTAVSQPLREVTISAG